MKKAIIFFFILYFFQNTIVSAQNTNAKTITETRKEIKTIQTILKVLNEKHIVPRKLDDVFSKQMFKTYIDSLDRERLFFLQSDIDEFKQYETKLDDQIKNNDLSFYDLTRKRYALRMTEAKEIYSNILKNELDFNKVEYKNDIKYFPINKEEIINNWIKFLKRAVLDFNKNSEEFDDSKSNKFETIILDYTSNSLKEKVESSFYNIDNFTNSKNFDIYLYSILNQFDRNTKFVAFKDFNAYLVKKSKKINGYGFNCVYKDDFIKINAIYIGGPAWKLKNIAKDDVILKVGLDNDQPKNIAGFLMQDVVNLLQSKPHNIVKLTLKKPNGTIVDVVIKRGVVSRDDSYIKSGIVTKNNIKFGIVSFSRFYNEVEEEEIKNDADDFKIEIQNLQKNNAQGLILDLRNNSDGNIDSVVKILNNFINASSVFQCKTNNNLLQPFKTDANAAFWSKGIVLLVNNKTAGAAEVLANTLKEYNIAVIIGQNTAGKATCEELINFSKYDNTTEAESDNLLVTTQKFYGLDGKSFENVGVKLDVNFSTTTNLNKVDNTKTDFVKPLPFTSANTTNHYKTELKNSKVRLDKSTIYKFLTTVNLKNELSNIKTLQAKKFKKEYDLLLEKQKNSGLTDYLNKLEFLAITKIENTLKGREYLIEKRKEWLAALSKDFIIEEGLNILEDMNSIK